jgi:CHAT domain-containing protein
VVLANPKGAKLPGTELAAEVLTTLFGSAQVLMGDTATEARLREHVRPRLLHVGVHGRFEHPGTHSEPPLEPGLILTAPPQPPGDPGSDDGLLTADELATMDLRGTELTALSACNSVGLRQSLALAGAHTQIVSLWPIPDVATAALWNAYYPRLAAGEGRGEAMREVQLEMLHSIDHRHPGDWASFVVVGDWGPLSVEQLGKVEGPPTVEQGGFGCKRASIGGDEQLGAVLLLGVLGLLGRRRGPHGGAEKRRRGVAR